MKGRGLRVWIRGAAALLGLVALAIGTWRSFPLVETEVTVEPALRVVLFDLSAGTTRRRPGHGIWARRRLREEALEAIEAGEELGVGLYAADVRRLELAPAQAWLDRLEGRGGEALDLSFTDEASLGSELDGGLALFEEELLRPERRAARLHLYAAQDFSGQDPGPRLARLARGGVDLRWRALAQASLPDLAIESVELPSHPAPGTPLVARVHLALAPGLTKLDALDQELGGELLIQVDDGAGLTQRELTLELPTVFEEGEGYLRWSSRIELGETRAGSTELQLRARLKSAKSTSSGDVVPENDRRSASCRSGATRLVGAVARADRLPGLRQWIEGAGRVWPGFQFSYLEPSELVAHLGELDLLLTFDLSPRDLPGELMSEFVGSGGGWFFCGGWGALPGWEGPSSETSSSAPREASSRELLPLRPEPEGRTPRDVIFLVDGSGSMAGGAFENVQDALARLALAADEQDSLWLRFFTGSLMEPIDLRVEDRDPGRVLEELFALRVPGGPTAIFYSLDQLVSERAGAERPSLTFLLTDGRDDVSYDIRTRGQAIATGLSGGESRFVVVAAGADPDRALLESLLPEGESLFSTTDLEDLDELFQREVFRGRIREGRISMELVPGGDLAESRDLLDAWSASSKPWPLHSRHLRCVPSPDADVLVRSSERGEPLLAWKRVGLGKVCAWSSCTLPEWAPEMQGARDLFAPLWRQLARSPEHDGTPKLVLASGRLVLAPVDLDWPAEVVAQFHAQDWGRSLAQPWNEDWLGDQSLWAQTVSPGDDMRRARSAPLPAFLTGAAFGRPLHVLLRSPVDGALLGQSGLTLACPPEFEATAGRRVPISAQGDDPFPRGSSKGEGVSDPRAWIWILAGLLGVSLGALLGGLESGAGGPGRRKSSPEHQGLAG